MTFATRTATKLDFQLGYGDFATRKADGEQNFCRSEDARRVQIETREFPTSCPRRARTHTDTVTLQSARATASNP